MFHFSCCWSKTTTYTNSCTHFRISSNRSCLCLCTVSIKYRCSCPAAAFHHPPLSPLAGFPTINQPDFSMPLSTTKIIPGSDLLRVAQADLAERRGNIEEANQVWKTFLSERHSTTGHIMYLRYAFRGGMGRNPSKSQSA